MNTYPSPYRAFLLVASFMLLPPQAFAADAAAPVQPVQYCDCGADCGAGCCDACDDDACCGGCCRKVCVATVEKEKVKKHCWCTKPKDICVPRVVLPWQEGGSGLTIFNFLRNRRAASCCGDACCGDACCGDACCDACCCVKPRCGRVITVSELEKKKYECEECVCKWEIRRLPPCCDGPCCGSHGCGDACGPECGATLCNPAAGCGR